MDLPIFPIGYEKKVFFLFLYSSILDSISSEREKSDLTISLALNRKRDSSSVASRMRPGVPHSSHGPPITGISGVNHTVHFLPR